MRTKEFTFKKTTKKVETFKGLSVDLTVADAAALLKVLGKIAGDDGVGGGVRQAREGFFTPLYQTLLRFVADNNGGSVTTAAKFYCIGELMLKPTSTTVPF